MKKAMMVSALALLAGCATKEMKSTPFYEGNDVTYTGRQEDRVNVWPIVYWREPVGSVLWPMVSFSDSHFSFFPFYSHEKEGDLDAGMELLEKDIKPRDIMTKDAFLNALTVDMALGCSTNTMLHIPAIAKEAGVDLNLDIANELSAKTPNLYHLAPAGPTYMEDLNEAGGVYADMKEIV